MKTFSTVPETTERNKNIICPLCETKVFKPLWVLDGYGFSKCPTCSLIYQNPQPIAVDVEDRYDDSYFNYEINNEESFLNLMLLGLKDIGFNFDNTSKTKKILDIGCATGLFLSHMKNLGWETSGVEICSSAVDYGNRIRGVNIFKGTLENAPFTEESFDIIHLSHVIEHINDPDLFLSVIYKLLKPGGVVYCTTPNADGFQAKLFKGDWRSAIADHMFLFTVKTLKAMIKKNGFTELKHKTWGGLCAGSGYPTIIKKILDKLAKPFGFGDVVIISAEKQK